MCDADFVCFDDYQGAYQAVSHLISLGHTRIASLTGLLDSVPGRERQRGYREAMLDHGLKVDYSLVFCGDFTYETAYLQMENMLELEEKPTAIFVSNNRMTEACIQLLVEHHIRIPEDIAVVAFYEPSWSRIVASPLTCVNANAYDIGKKSAEMLMRRINGYKGPSEYIKIPTELIVRESSGEKLALSNGMC